MKRNPSESNSRRLLILSDGKPGHVNQAIAFARHLQLEFEICPVRFISRWAKLLAYLLDRVGLYRAGLLELTGGTGDYAAVVSAGSETYYANKLLARKARVPAVAIMLPKGYRYDFDLIVAQQHDRPPQRRNILALPVNLTYVEPRALVTPSVPDAGYVALIVGGDSRRGGLDAARLQRQVARIFELFPRHRFWLTTSRRTPAAVESMLRNFPWERAVYYSEEQINPIPDYLQHSSHVFLTADSTSMISEAVSFGSACVEILGADQGETGHSKLDRMIARLVEMGAVHVFTDEPGTARTKLNLSEPLRSITAALGLPVDNPGAGHDRR